ncbi:MAG: tetratricopeptide repeat protein [Candidatus Omnitrophica bacterium]|nr:tetratricopeptide repeat protein [Candidatus Omnitrophota bacterium]
MKLKKTLIITMFFAGVIFATALGFSQTDTDMSFEQASVCYGRGEYDKAVAVYEDILSGGVESRSIYYNLGNAYFKLGAMGKAILNYERAKKIMPRDADLAANIRLARSMIKGGKVVSERTIWDWYPVKVYSNNFSLNEITIFSSGMYIAAILLLILGVVNPNIKRKAIVITIILFIFIAINTLIMWRKDGGMGRDAVVISSQTDALFGPFDSETKFFTLYEGVNCDVVRSKGEWCKIRREDGKTGWVKKDEIEIV